MDITKADLKKQIDDWLNKIRETGSIQYDDVNRFITPLNNITGKDMPDDPFKNHIDTLFRYFSLAVAEIKKQYGIYSFKKYYEKCLQLEIKDNDRIHKADALYFIGRYYYDLGKYSESFYYWILTFLDDILSEHHRTADTAGNVFIKNALDTPIYEWIQVEFDIPGINLQDLRNNALNLLKTETNKVFNPEILKFKLASIRHEPPKLINY